MDETLKARLIGAAVLVALAVLLIPELLSGRKSPDPVVAEGSGTKGTRTFTIELEGIPGQSARTPPEHEREPGGSSVRETSTRPLEAAPPPAPQPAPPGRRDPAPAATAAAAPASASPVARPQQRSEPPAAAVRSGWSVQVGAFGSVEAARKLVKDLEVAGYRAYVSPVTRSGKTLQRVRVGPEPQRADAERLAGRLKARGLPATVVEND